MGKVKPRAKDTKEIRIQMAIQDVQNPTPPAPPLSIRRAAEMYGVSRSTVPTGVKGLKTRTESQAKHQTLTPDEEGEIVRWIEKLDDMAIPPRATHVIRMVEAILSKRPPQPCGQGSKEQEAEGP
jgi:transposase